MVRGNPEIGVNPYDYSPQWKKDYLAEIEEHRPAVEEQEKQFAEERKKAWEKIQKNVSSGGIRLL